MKYFLLLLIFLSGMAHSYGLLLVDDELQLEYEIELKLKFSEFRSCFEINALLPKALSFPDLGPREIHAVIYQKAEKVSSNPYDLELQGSSIWVDTTIEQDRVKLKPMCISRDDLVSSYLFVTYVGGEGTPSMGLYIPLFENSHNNKFKRDAARGAP